MKIKKRMSVPVSTILNEIHKMRVMSLRDNALRYYEECNFRMSLECANTAYLLGQEDMLNVIVKCNMVLTGVSDVKVHAFKDVYSTEVKIVKPKVDPNVDMVLKAVDLNDLFKSPNGDVLKLGKKLYLKIHPDKCKDPRANMATIKLNGMMESWRSRPNLPEPPSYTRDKARADRKNENFTKEPRKPTTFRSANDDSDDEDHGSGFMGFGKSGKKFYGK